ncbi:MAG: ABC transporter permease subunit, partial [Verrucomicrobia bacterium]|nr:ABC transporter permease subunit [Verrucomicrobiota bacterium]
MFNPTWKALLFKEWREQRWRFFLSSLVFCMLTAGLLRAQVIPTYQAILLINWPVGILMALFLAMGPIAGERGNRTWEFLVAQPISRKELIAAKWLMGFLQLIGVITMSTLAGELALWSRGIHFVTSRFHDQTLLQQLQIQMSPMAWVGLSGFISAVVLGCWYTPLFFLLIRARDESMAALMGVLLTGGLHVWLGVLCFYRDFFEIRAGFAAWWNLANPLCLFTLRQ